MPVDSDKFSSPVSSGDKVDAEDIRSRFSELERFVNGGIKSSDVKYRLSSETVGVTNTLDLREDAFETRHLIKPEFYLGGNTRIEGVISDTYHRHVPQASMNRYFRHEQSGMYFTDLEGFSSAVANDLPHAAWQPIDGMSATIDVKGDETVNAYVCGSLYAFASGGTDFQNDKIQTQAQNSSRGDNLGQELSSTQMAAYTRMQASGAIIAIFKLYVQTPSNTQPEAHIHTERRLFNRGESSYNCRRQQISFTHMVELEPGINKVSYRCVYRLKTIEARTARHLYVDGRNFFVDVHYK